MGVFVLLPKLVTRIIGILGSCFPAFVSVLHQQTYTLGYPVRAHNLKLNYIIFWSNVSLLIIFKMKSRCVLYMNQENQAKQYADL
jgi:hypothetical protein